MDKIGLCPLIKERERERERKKWWQTIKSMRSLNLLPSQQKFWGKRNKIKYIDIKKNAWVHTVHT